MTRILARLAADLASNALTACVTALHEASGVWLHGAEWSEWNKRERARFSLQTQAERYVRAARERRQAS